MRLRRIVTATAAVCLTPLFVTAPVTVGAAGAAPGPVTPVEEHVELLAPEAAAVGDGESTSRRDLELARAQAAESGTPVSDPEVLEVTAPTPVRAELSVVGVTWRRGTGKAPIVQYRTRLADGWGRWQAIDVDQASGTDGEAGATERAGSEPVVVTGAREVQARLLGPSDGTPTEAKLSVIDPQSSPADDTAGAAPAASAAAAVARPQIISRASWGADESIRRAGPTYASVRSVVVHHTAGTNSYSPEQVPAILRGIYAFHVKSRGWNDIGYNVLVDKWGRVWEGRYGGVDKAVAGAHTAGYNSVTAGISLMGDYSTTAPSSSAVESIARVIAWKAWLHGFSPTEWTTLYGKSYRTVIGHREAGQTACPGNALFAKLPAIRTRAAAIKSSSGTTAPPPSQPSLVQPARRDLDGVAGGDVVARDRVGDLYAASVTGGASLSKPIRIGRRWSSIDMLLPGDWNGDGTVDLLARERRSGRLKVYPMSSSGRLGQPVTVGKGWNTMSHVVAPGDLTGDGRVDLLAVNRFGRLYVYPVTGGGKVSNGRNVGRGWSGFRHLVAVGDWTGDRVPDVVGINSTGKGLLYPGAGRGSFRTPQSPSGDWWRFNRIAGAGASTRSGAVEVVGTDTKGNTFIGKVNTSGKVGWNQVSPGLAGYTLYSG